MTTIGQHTFRKPTNKTLSAQFDATLPDAKLYRDLVSAEHRLDAIINRKKLDLEDAARDPRKSKQYQQLQQRKSKKTVRVFVSNKAEDQEWQKAARVDDPEFDAQAEAAKQPAWTVRIEGRVLDDEDETKQGEEQQQQQHKKFSQYFTSITVQFDKTVLAPTENPIAEWHEDPAVPDKVTFDALDIRRHGDRPVPALVTLQPKERPDKLQLSPALGRVLGLDRESKPGVVLALWHYVRVNKLQDAEEQAAAGAGAAQQPGGAAGGGRVVKCDKALRELFGVDKFVFSQAVGLLEPHLLIPPPIVINYEVQVSAADNLGDLVYDIEIDVEEDTPPAAGTPEALLANWSQDAAAIQSLDDQLALTVQAMTNSRLKQQFLAAFAKDPATTVAEWLASQRSDMGIIESDKGFNEEMVRHSEFYTEEVLNQNVHLFLNNRR